MRIIGKAIAAAGILGFLAFLTGCVPTSEHPIVGDDPDFIDERLSGTWRGVVADGLMLVHFFEPKDGEVPIILISQDEDEAGVNDGWAYATARVATMDGALFLSVHIPTVDGEAVKDETEGLHLLNYHYTDDGRIELMAIDEELIEADIKAGLVGGRVESGRFYTSLRLTAQSASLAEYIRERGRSVVFSKPYGSLAPVAPPPPADTP